MWVALGAGLAAYGAFEFGLGCLILLGALYLIRLIRGAKVVYPCLNLGLCLLGLIRADAFMDNIDRGWPQQQSTVRTQLIAQVIATERREDHLLVKVEGVAPITGIIQLRTYAEIWQRQPIPISGECWQFDVRLKRPQFSENPGGFSYERHLYRQGVVALGNFKTARKLKPPSAWSLLKQELLAPIIATRQSLSQRIQGLTHQGLLSALWLGDRQGLTEQQRSVIQQTGTQHLLVVSGMHLSTMAGFAMLLAAVLSRCWQGCLLHSAQRQTHWVGFILTAVLTALYAALSGFKIPALRALLMLWLALWMWWKGVSLRSLKPWSFALGCIVLLDPLAIFDVGLYLSFAAVAALLLAFTPISITPQAVMLKTNAVESRIGTLHKEPNTKLQALAPVLRMSGVKLWGYVRSLCLAQLSVGLVMTPLLLILDLPLAPQGIWVNFWAIPWVTLWLLPMSWCMLVLHFCVDTGWPLTFLDQQLGYFWSALVSASEMHWNGFTWDVLNRLLAEPSELWLTWMSQPKPMSLVVTQPETLAPNILGWLLLLVHIGWFLPKSLCPRALLLPLMLTLWGFSYWQLRLLKQGCITCQPSGTFEVHILDVGQGSAALVRTAAGDWLIDVGPKYRSGNTQWAMQIQPYLSRLGIESLAGVIVSHTDMDHAGGLEELRQAIPVTHWVTPDQPNACGSWQQAGVKLEWFRRLDRDNVNDQSVVVLVSSSTGTALFPGDISRKQEVELLKNAPLAAIKSVQLLLAPHHGSQTSSSWTWVKRLQPSWVVFSAGFANTYRHPHPKIEARYQTVGSQTLSTFATGLVVFRFDAGQSWKAPSIYRAQILGRWQRQLNASNRSLTADLDKGE